MTKPVVTTPQGTALTARAKRDRRINYRVPMEHLGVAASVEAATPTKTLALGLLVNMSAGGCCVVVAADAAQRFTRGAQCHANLPVTENGLRYPAILVAIEPYGATGHDMLLRLRFRKADAVTQQLLTRWIGELGIQAWHK